MNATTSTRTPALEPPEVASDAIFQRVLVPIDFSPAAKRALGVALAMNRSLGSEVHLFNLTESSENERFLAGVGSDAVAGRDLVSHAEQRLARYAENVFPGRSRDTIAHAKIGVDVVDGVCRAAKETGATLVVLGGRHKDTVLRSALERIARELDCAVMFVWE